MTDERPERLDLGSTPLRPFVASGRAASPG